MRDVVCIWFKWIFKGKWVQCFSTLKDFKLPRIVSFDKLFQTMKMKFFSWFLTKMFSLVEKILMANWVLLTTHSSWEPIGVSQLICVQLLGLVCNLIWGNWGERIKMNVKWGIIISRFRWLGSHGPIIQVLALLTKLSLKD